MPENYPDIYANLTEYTQQKCQDYFEEVKKILPNLPQTIQFSIDNGYLINGTASGGSTNSRQLITVAFDPFFNGLPEQKEAHLRATIFHESYHVAQNFTYEGRMPTPIENAIYEGAATVFERNVAGSKPGWGEYSDDVASWVEEVKALPNDYDYRKWKFYDPETGRQWILYRTGTYIVDQALKHSPSLTITDLANEKYDKILELAKL